MTDVAARRERPALAIAATLAVVIGLLVLVLMTRAPATDRAVESPLIGDLVPAVAGDTLDGGEQYDIDQERGRWVVVNFFAAWCVPCVREHPELVRFAERHEQAGDATIVSVIYDDAPDDVRALFDDLGGDWPVVIDAEGRTALEFGVTGVPESFLVAPDGTVVAKVEGGVSAAGLDGLIERVTEGP